MALAIQGVSFRLIRVTAFRSTTTFAERLHLSGRARGPTSGGQLSRGSSCRKFGTRTRLGRLSKTEEKAVSSVSADADDEENALEIGEIGDVDIIDLRRKDSAVRPDKISGDLAALKKYDVIVNVDAETSPRIFAADKGLPDVMQPDKDLSGRRKPQVMPNDVINPRYKGKPLLIGDRKNPPKFDFTLRNNLFEDVEKREGGKTKKGFEKAIKMFCNVDPYYRRGHVEFIYKATNLLKEYKLEKDLDAFKAILDLFPQGPYIPKSRIQATFTHYPRQQDCAMDVMCYMEEKRVIPDKEFGEKLKAIFSEHSRAYYKFRRMTYWMPKFRYSSPFPPIPLKVEEEDPRDIAKMALERICVDLENQISFYEVDRQEKFNDSTKPWIASGISPKQSELISRLPTDQAIYVKGPFALWLRGFKVDHFVLWAPPGPPPPEQLPFEEHIRLSKDLDEILECDPMRQAFGGVQRKNPLAKRPSCHEQEDGVILSLAVLEEFSHDLLMSWIKCLEKTNPHLSQVPVIFSLTSPPPTELVPHEDDGVDEDSEILMVEPS